MKVLATLIFLVCVPKESLFQKYIEAPNKNDQIKYKPPPRNFENKDFKLSEIKEWCDKLKTGEMLDSVLEKQQQYSFTIEDCHFLDSSSRRTFLYNLYFQFCTPNQCHNFSIPSSNNLRINGAPNITQIDILSGFIPVLYPDYITDMPKLRTLKMNRLGIVILEVGAFKNLPQLEYLSLQKNNFMSIAMGVFNELVSLKELHLENNLIKTILPGSFHAMPKLCHLHLSFNKISVFDQRWFSGNALLELRLDHNEIKSVVLDSQHLKRNAILDFEYNKISFVASNFDMDFAKVKTLNLANNQITCIESKLEDFFRVKNVHLEKNPLDCQCLERIQNFVYNYDHFNITLSTNPRCNVTF